MGLINEFVVKEKLLVDISKAFDETTDDTSNKEEFMSLVEKSIDKYLMNQKI